MSPCLQLAVSLRKRVCRVDRASWRFVGHGLPVTVVKCALFDRLLRMAGSLEVGKREQVLYHVR